MAFNNYTLEKEGGESYDAERYKRKVLLEQYFEQIDSVILSRQNPISGLLPASTAITAHGDYTDAWVRDNVYSILAVWGLALAFRQLDHDDGKGYHLQQSVVKLMRGLLVSMMKQADKVERFKQSQHTVDALHAKYDTQTGDPVVGDQDWGHLQIDATSLYLLMLAQMTASGLRIIFTMDEVNFIQNLVYYIGRAYRTPDYGIWERGNKINHGIAELNASSVGMAKAALEALNGFNVFGVEGGQASVIHVVPDEIARARVTLWFLLPRESNSKETDAALLSIIGFPAFAMEDAKLVKRTREVILSKLGGRYGCKRFMLDGHQTMLEDASRLHYEPSELKEFEHIESEWPLFFSYLVLDGLFRGDEDQVKEYSTKLASLFVEQNGQRLLPELYYVSADKIEAEREQPHSQERVPNDNVPLVWAQSLYWLGALIQDGLLTLSDIDPLNRRSRLGYSRQVRVLVAPMAENEKVKSHLQSLGIQTQTLDEVAPFRVRQAEDLARAFVHVGKNAKLGLTGRPMRRPRGLTTSHVYMLRGEKVVFLPQFMDKRNFYLTLDDRLMVERFTGELAYLARHWDSAGNPLIVLLIDESMLSDESADRLINCMREMQSGICNGVAVRVGALTDLAKVAGKERIDYLPEFSFSPAAIIPETPRCSLVSHDPALCRVLSVLELPGWQEEFVTKDVIIRLWSSRNLHEQIALLSLLWKELGPDAEIGATDNPCTIRQFVAEIYQLAGETDIWAVIRQAAGLLGLHDATLEDAVVIIVVRQKQLAVGRSYSSNTLISKPECNADILEKIALSCGDDERERILNQEVILYLAMLIKSEAYLFEGMRTLRPGHLLQLITGQLAIRYAVPQHAAFDYLVGLSPHSLLENLREVLRSYQDMVTALAKVESLNVHSESGSLARVRFDAEDDPLEFSETQAWRAWRESHGVMMRVREELFEDIWNALEHCKGIIVGDRFNPGNCLDSEVIHGQMTAGERNFAFLVDHLLNNIAAPDYRHLTMEALSALITIIKANPEIHLDDYIVLDVLIGYAVRLAWLDMHPSDAEIYNEKRSDAWAYFYQCAPHQVGNAIMAAFAFLVKNGREADLEPALLEQEQ